MRKLRHEEIDWAEHAPGAPHPLRLVVENVRSIHNVGAMFRTADAAGLEWVHLTGFTGTPEHPGMRKTSLGAERIIPWSHHSSAPEALDMLRADGYGIVALEIAEDAVPVHSGAIPPYPLALVVGNEVDGISQSTLDLCDEAVYIPQYGRKQSLNVSVACGIALFALVARYRSSIEAPA